MPEQPPLPAKSIDQVREEVGRVLSDHFAEDRIDVDEFERRLELTFKATSIDAVRAQLDGLSDASTVPAHSALQDMPEAAIAPRRPPSNKTFLAFMSVVARKGAWTVPSTMNVISFMGGVELDLRRARLDPGITRINVFAMMGGVEITVAPNVRVETDGMAIMGAFEDRGADKAKTPFDGPVLRVTGIAFMGAVEVRVKVADPQDPD